MAGESLSLRVVKTLAEQEGVEPTELEPPLYDVIDTEALDALFRSTAMHMRNSNGSVEFTYGSYRVRVDSNGTVSVSSTNVTNSVSNSTVLETAED